MIIKKLYLKNFRNFNDEYLFLSPGVNLLLGANAQGKTNLLEAVYFLLKGFSFKTRASLELISSGQKYSFIKGEVNLKKTDHIIETMINSKQEKKWKINGKKGPLSISIPIVIFTPEDLYLIKGVPALRRRLLDQYISDIYPLYQSIIRDFSRALHHRNELLKKSASFSRYTLQLQMEPWEENMAANAAKICSFRKKIIKDILPFAADIHQEISNGEEFDLKYDSQVEISSDEKSLEAEWLNLYRNHRDEEIKRRITLWGPQRDDLKILINGVCSRKYASQGQQRTASLALKICQIPLLEEYYDETPLLILDDVFSELDEKRIRSMVNRLLERGQALVTSTTAPNLQELNPAIFKITAGRIDKFG